MPHFISVVFVVVFPWYLHFLSSGVHLYLYLYTGIDMHFYRWIAHKYRPFCNWLDRGRNSSGLREWALQCYLYKEYATCMWTTMISPVGFAANCSKAVVLMLFSFVRLCSSLQRGIIKFMSSVGALVSCLHCNHPLGSRGWGVVKRALITLLFRYLVTFILYVMPVMRKHVLAICEQQRCRSAYVSAQSDWHLCCSLQRKYNTYTC